MLENSRKNYYVDEMHGNVVLGSKNEIIGELPEGYKVVGYLNEEEELVITDKSIEYFYIPEGITKIAEEAFMGCARLMEIRIPEGVVSIGDCAFMGCVGLDVIKFPDSLKIIPRGALYNCAYIQGIGLPKDLEVIEGEAFYGCLWLKELKIPNSVRIIGEYALEYCNKLEVLELPDNLESIGIAEFESFAEGFGGSKLKEIRIPKNPKFDMDEFMFIVEDSAVTITTKE